MIFLQKVFLPGALSSRMAYIGGGGGGGGGGTRYIFLKYDNFRDNLLA